MSSVRNIALSAAMTALALAPAQAMAADDTDTFTVSATVLATCDVTADDLSFGSYNPIAAAHLDAATTLSVTCTSGTAYNVGMSLGAGAGASTATRYMTHNSNALAYTLYRNSGRTNLWGTTIGSNTLAATGDGTPDTIDVFGRVTMQQAVPAGAYTDTITVTVTW